MLMQIFRDVDFVDFLYFFNTNDIKYIQIFRYIDILRLHAI